ncbi:ribosome small subunit-dependent GTPase A [Lapidilactobacillus gannanensis]|uniref:Small ribosomal subunit biogenesis GTPase RsgA n=1 Tax=Lapidilactobacillus gannanensis TaxID=2486002 RepID=A0ABW4BPV4_9LACO|nr:ribosome small subunit-dependent GTPase A [Lapidilactobacillus gannanensis]
MTINKGTKHHDIKARIIGVHQDLFDITCSLGTGLARIKQGSYRDSAAMYPTIGDQVLVNWQGPDQSIINTTLPRQSYFKRLDGASCGHWAQAVAANFDEVFIMQALGADFNLRRLERYLTLAWESGGVPVVLLTKADLVSSAELATKLTAAQEIAIGVEVLAISNQSHQGYSALQAHLQPVRTIVLLGSSGVGKSTLVNQLQHNAQQATANIRAKDQRGRHTTSQRQLLTLATGTAIIDTPGMRELGIWDAETGLSQSFADIEKYFSHCRFRDCRHQQEPGCAIKQALRNGELSRDRWASYQQLQSESDYNTDKQGYLQAKKQRLKTISQFQRRHQQNFEQQACGDSFICQNCGRAVLPENAGTKQRNHCPYCLASLHVDHRPGDRSALCHGIMDAISIWTRANGEQALIHRCRECGQLVSNRIAADDDAQLLAQLATQPGVQPRI